jgi:tRNA pseudouridine38-40 synthase
VSSDRSSAAEAAEKPHAERTFRLVLEYDGRDFEGWQIQAGDRPARTIQGVLRDAVESITGHPASIRGAGRTDAGVHAFGQVASVRAQTAMSAKALARALNGRLPGDVAVRCSDDVPDGWDALREASGKHYRYQIWNGARRSPLRAARFHWQRDPLRVDHMREAAQCFLGTHDFAAMAGAGSSVKTTIRTILDLRIVGETGGEVVIDVEGEGFLRHMVRNLVGTLLEIGRGRWEVARAAEILASLDRGEAGPTAPAQGLALISVVDGWTLRREKGRERASPAVSRGSSVDESSPVG